MLRVVQPSVWRTALSPALFLPRRGYGFMDSCTALVAVCGAGALAYLHWWRGHGRVRKQRFPDATLPPARFPLIRWGKSVEKQVGVVTSQVEKVVARIEKETTPYWNELRYRLFWKSRSERSSAAKHVSAILERLHKAKTEDEITSVCKEITQFVLSTSDFRKTHAFLRQLIDGHKGLERLVPFLKSTSPRVQACVLTVLGCITEFDASARDLLRRLAAVPMIVRLLALEDDDVQISASYAIENIAYAARNRKAIKEVDGVRLLVHLLSSQHVGVVRQAAAALAVMCLGDDEANIGAEILQYNGIHNLHRLLVSEDAKTRENALEALALCAGSGRRMALTIVRLGLTPILALLTSSEHKSQEFAALALYYCASQRGETVEAVRSSGALEILERYAGDLCAPVELRDTSRAAMEAIKRAS